jgi:nicotinamide mononucleotide adenylyltransferase
MTLIIGSSETSGTADNPWSYLDRLSIITDTLSEEFLNRMTIYPLPDTSDDDIWCDNLKNIIPHNSVLFTGNEWVRDICARHDIETDWIVPTIDISATQIREMIARGEDVSQWTTI